MPFPLPEAVAEHQAESLTADQFVLEVIVNVTVPAVASTFCFGARLKERKPGSLLPEALFQEPRPFLA